MSGPVLLLSIVVPILPETLPSFPPPPKPLQVVRLTTKEASLDCGFLSGWKDGRFRGAAGAWARVSSCFSGGCEATGKILHTHTDHKFAI